MKAEGSSTRLLGVLQGCRGKCLPSTKHSVLLISGRGCCQEQRGMQMLACLPIFDVYFRYFYFFQYVIYQK